MKIYPGSMKISIMLNSILTHCRSIFCNDEEESDDTHPRGRESERERESAAHAPKRERERERERERDRRFLRACTFYL
jgi:hypothetical protein